MTIKLSLTATLLFPESSAKGAPFEPLKASQERRFRLLISLPILNEYRRVLEELTKKRPSAVLGSILELRFASHSRQVGLASVKQQINGTASSGTYSAAIAGTHSGFCHNVRNRRRL